MGFFGKLIYPVFGIVVLIGYAYVVRNGIEPFQVSSEERAAPTGPQAKHASTRYRPRGVYFFGGFGGK